MDFPCRSWSLCNAPIGSSPPIVQSNYVRPVSWFIRPRNPIRTQSISRDCANFVLKVYLRPRPIGIGGDSENHLRAQYKEKTGKPVETPSLFKNVVLPFLNRLSYVQFVSGAPIFQDVSPSSLFIAPALCSKLCSLWARPAVEHEPSFHSRVVSSESPGLTRCT